MLWIAEKRTEWNISEKLFSIELERTGMSCPVRFRKIKKEPESGQKEERNGKNFLAGKLSFFTGRGTERSAAANRRSTEEE